MRLWLVVLLAACSTTDSGSGHSNPPLCPATLTEGDSCSFSGSCWHDDTFSSCMSGWCTCRAGHVRCEPLAPSEGDACGSEPIVQCSYEGNPSCDTNPTAEWCGCDETGTWRCECLCYGGLASCPIDPCTLAPEKIDGVMCGYHGGVCTYPSNTTCTCEQANDGTWRFACR